MERVNGNQILEMCQRREFKDGDILIALQENSLGGENISVYKFREYGNGAFSFIDMEYECELEIYDLSECDFIIIQPKRSRVEEAKAELDNRINEWTAKAMEVAERLKRIEAEKEFQRINSRR